MEFRPFGRELNGERIQDVSGVIVRANLDYLVELVIRSRGLEAGKVAIEELVYLLNTRIPDRAFHVTPEFLKNQWNSYSYEFVMFLNEFCAVLSGDDQFSFHVGRKKFLSPIIQLLGRPLSIKQIYRLYPYFIGKFTKGALLPEVMTVKNGMAVMRLRFSDRTVHQFGPYLRSCADRICQTTKVTIAEVPSRMFGLQAAVIQDNQCIGDGADFCEWTFTWQPQENKSLVWLGVGAILAVVMVAILQTWSPQFPVWLKIGLALVPGMIFWLAGALWTDRQELQARGEIIQEQLDTTEARHEELREAYVDQEQNLMELRGRIAELAMVHEVGLAIGSTLDRNAVIQKGLEFIINNLPYDRIIVSLYDPVRSVAHDSRVVGVSLDMASYAKSVEVPIDDEGLESTVLKKAMPLVVEDIKEVLPRLHPLNQQLLKMFHSRAFVAVPLMVHTRILGALVADRVESKSFMKQDIALLSTLANQIAIALDNASAYEEIEQLNIDLEARLKQRTAGAEGN